VAWRLRYLLVSGPKSRTTAHVPKAAMVLYEPSDDEWPESTRSAVLPRLGVNSGCRGVSRWKEEEVDLLCLELLQLTCHAPALARTLMFLAPNSRFDAWSI
jgi:hypothetical protein